MNRITGERQKCFFKKETNLIYTCADIKWCSADIHATPSAGKSGSSALHCSFPGLAVTQNLAVGGFCNMGTYSKSGNSGPRTACQLAIPLCNHAASLLGYCEPIGTLNPEALFVFATCKELWYIVLYNPRRKLLFCPPPPPFLPCRRES